MKTLEQLRDDYYNSLVPNKYGFISGPKTASILNAIQKKLSKRRNHD